MENKGYLIIFSYLRYFVSYGYSVSVSNSISISIGSLNMATTGQLVSVLLPILSPPIAEDKSITIQGVLEFSAIVQKF